MRKAQSLAAALSLLAFSVAQTAIADEARSLLVRGIRVEESGGLSVFLSLFDGANKPLTVINPGSFLLEIDGAVVKSPTAATNLFAKSGEGRAFLLGIDVSGSMQAVMPAIRTSLGQYVLSLRPALDKMAIGEIGNDWKIVQGFTSDQIVLKKAIESVKPVEVGTTALFESIHLGTQALHAPSATAIPARRSMLVVTDGLNEKIGRTAEECIAEAKKSLIQIHSLMYLPKATEKHLAAKGLLEKISRDTGGLTVTTADPKEFDTAFINLQRSLDSEIVLTLGASDIPTDGREHSLVLRYDQASGSAGFQARNIAKSESPKVDVKPKDGNKNTVYLLGGTGALVLLVGATSWIFVRRRKRRMLIEATANEAAMRAQEQSMMQEAALTVEQIPEQRLESLSELSPIQNDAAVASSRKTQYRPAGAAGNSQPSLRVIRGENMGSVLQVPSFGGVIGRNSDNAVVLDVDSVSGKHAEFSQDSEGQWQIRDLNSTNGTLINNQRIGQTPSPLYDGISVQLGLVVLRFELK